MLETYSNSAMPTSRPSALLDTLRSDYSAVGSALTQHQRNPITILSNLSLSRLWKFEGVAGQTVFAATFWQMLSKVRACDLVIVDDNDLTLKMCGFLFLAPFMKRPIVAVDLVLREPKGMWAHVKSAVIRALLLKVSLFIHYFSDLSGYNRYFGISPERSEYVPFKPNLRGRIVIDPKPEGDYVLCLGQSMRDYKTFFEAIERLHHYPAAVSRKDLKEVCRQQRKLRQPILQVPANVRILEDDGSDGDMVRIIGNAKLVVVPILKGNICASGIGIYLNSMLLGKCVIISATPGASDTLTNQALLVSPENSQELSQMIQKAWTDTRLRTKTAEAGYAYAMDLGTEHDFYGRILHRALSWYIPSFCAHAHRS